MTEECGNLINMMVHHYASAGGNSDASLMKYCNGKNLEKVDCIKKIVNEIERKYCDAMFDGQRGMSQDEIFNLIKNIANEIEPNIKDEGLKSLFSYASWMAWHEGFSN